MGTARAGISLHLNKMHDDKVHHISNYEVSSKRVFFDGNFVSKANNGTRRLPSCKVVFRVLATLCCPLAMAIVVCS